MKTTLNLCVLIAAMIVCFCPQANGVMISAEPAESLVLQDRNRNPLDEDACPPQTIVSLPITINGNTTTSAHNYDMTCAENYAGDDIYAISIRCDATIRVSLCGSGYDTMVEVGVGTNYFSCPGTPLVCSDDFCGFQSEVTFYHTIDNWYFIVVGGYGFDTGAYTLTVTADAYYAPDNDGCNGARLISNAPYQNFGSTECANNSIDPGATAQGLIENLSCRCGSSANR